MDGRARRRPGQRIQETEDPALKYNGFGAVSAELGLPKALWLKEHERRLGTARHGSASAPTGPSRLTGEATTSVNTASGKYYYDRDEGGFPERLYEAVGVEDLLDKTPSGCSTWAPSAS